MLEELEEVASLMLTYILTGMSSVPLFRSFDTPTRHCATLLQETCM